MPDSDRDAATRATGIETFITRWRNSGGAERANYALFLSELCDLLGVARPDAAVGGSGPYRFERAVTRHERDGTVSTRRIDLYKRGCFVLEAKQAQDTLKQPALFAASEAERRAHVRRSPGWAQLMLRAKGQAEDYARDIPPDEGWPPFILVCDVGFCIDVYADFSGTGKHYAQFPDRDGYRVHLTDLRNPAVRARLRAIWTDPMGLDPSRRRVQVTREIAALLAHLATELEARKHTPESVATFLMRSVFSMFAQSVGLLPSKAAFTDLLEACRTNLAGFVPLVGDMWRTMDTGGFSSGLRADLRRFNGGLFAPGAHGAAEPLPLDADMLDLLIAASKRDWSHVEPAIFGTLLENAINKHERGRLGAHFTPRAFVERLVQPALMDPLLAEWDGVKASALLKAEAGDNAGAADAVRGFHARLCAVRVLDPACGTANFLYVALDMMKRLDGEVLDVLADLVAGEGDRLDLTQATVDPHQFLGLELNPRAVPVAELVLWLGWLQWHFRNRPGREVAEPILRDFHNIRHADALLGYREEEVMAGVTRWGGRTTLHRITGEEVPDETDRVLALRPKDAKPTVWPEADFIVGNPPFIGAKYLREHIGDGYAGVLWAAYPKVNRSADLALYFWWKAAQAVAVGKARRFGFITSNSLRQVFCRRVVADALDARAPVHLVFAVPDHPWTDSIGSAAVRIAMTVAEAGHGNGVLATVIAERAGKDGVPEVTLETRTGQINADLTIGTDVKATKPLRANERIASPGVKLHGAGFIVSPAKARALGLGKVPGLDFHIRAYLNGRDLQQRSRGAMVIDLFGLTEDVVRRRFGAVWQHLHGTVKAQRDALAGNGPDTTQYAREWWLFGKTRPDLRSALTHQSAI
ncbi:MAG: type IIL restriction-modification enzyme MmeI [Acetobacteraceae bacterium]